MKLKKFICQTRDVVLKVRTKKKSKTGQLIMVERPLDLLGGCKDTSISWGGVKIRTSKRSKMGETSSAGLVVGSDSTFDLQVKEENTAIGHSTSMEVHGTKHPSSGFRNQEGSLERIVHEKENAYRTSILRNSNGEKNYEGKNNGESSSQYQEVCNGTASPCVPHAISTENHVEVKNNVTVTPTKLRIRSGSLSRDCISPCKTAIASPAEDGVKCDTMRENSNVENGLDIHSGIGVPCTDLNRVLESEDIDGASYKSLLEGSFKLDYSEKMLTSADERSKSSRCRRYAGDCGSMEASTSSVRKLKLEEEIEIPPEGIRRARSIRVRPAMSMSRSNFKFKEARDFSEDTSNDVNKASPIRNDENSCDEWQSESRNTIQLRSTRSKRGNCIYNSIPLLKSHQSGRSSWLMLSAHEEGSRYIPQKGDEVVYLRQGHQEYISHTKSRNNGPWATIKGNIRAVEVCRVEGIEYSTHPGSGESCCIMALKFVDPSSVVMGKSFKLTLPEVTGFPDFLVERSRYDASVARNWTCRDKCQVWWKNEGEEDGGWWEGRIINVKPKSLEFPDSPWERYGVKYKSDPTETHNHSPWELYDAQTHWEQPRIDDHIRDELIHALAKLDESGGKAQDYYGVNKLKQVSQKTNFINRFPVPLSLEIIWARLENNYYRSLEAFEHDVEVMMSNAESYFGRNAEVSTKMKRMSEWFRRAVSSL